MTGPLGGGHHSNTATAQPSSTQSIEGNEQEGSIDNDCPLQPEKLPGSDNNEKGGFFSSPWTPRRIAFFSILGFLGLAIIALVIALPIVLTRHHRKHAFVPTGTTHEDPSYHIEENHPVWAVHDFPDPGLIQHNGTWYAFGTNPKKNDPDTIHVPVATSTNFVNWTLHEDYDAMPTMGKWQKKVNTWAPDLIQRNDGKFVLYYAGESKNFTPHHCIGAAVSEATDPMGPYTPLNESLACPHKYGGAIDPSPFKDKDGKLYIVYKGDGNSVGSGGYCGNSKKPRKPVPIFLQELQSDGITTTGDAVIVLDINDTDGPLVEAPNLIHINGTYFLFFSSHCFTSLGYNVKYAHSRSIKGPYKRAVRPLLQTEDWGLEAPGGATISPDGTRMVFHANCGGWRCMYAAAVDILTKNDTVVMSSLTFEVFESSNSTNATSTSAKT
ncbi:Glycoside hydrolase family 43 [Penicillium angulare]|uniref:Glycoside hydrolase family 43 n=1 Tax=Penicillium angulare TaxID=116970 RepID=UPI0025417BAF|nr:Glycoside hydrolase family 43 [Penicillium angulare]KAJ5280130.1 Glycoside hydrolase family 43 [Penicillium angulare]